MVSLRIEEGSIKQHTTAMGKNLILFSVLMEYPILKVPFNVGTEHKEAKASPVDIRAKLSKDFGISLIIGGVRTDFPCVNVGT
uniref:BATS domain-containing protein n=1 Tax=Angiostrongylus cantonensis TaxID=6313 RepID=A0A0K0CUC7_ANGCA